MKEGSDITSRNHKLQATCDVRGVGEKEWTLFTFAFKPSNYVAMLLYAYFSFIKWKRIQSCLGWFQRETDAVPLKRRGKQLHPNP